VWLRDDFPALLEAWCVQGARVSFHRAQSIATLNKHYPAPPDVSAPWPAPSGMRERDREREERDRVRMREGVLVPLPGLVVIVQRASFLFWKIEKCRILQSLSLYPCTLTTDKGRRMGRPAAPPSPPETEPSLPLTASTSSTSLPVPVPVPSRESSRASVGPFCPPHQHPKPESASTRRTSMLTMPITAAPATDNPLR
jgi:hypothetical protein